MDRRKFFTLTGTFTGGTLLLPDFLMAYGKQPMATRAEQSVVFVQLNGGNDGLNTFVPIDDPLYAALRPAIGLSRDKVMGKSYGMAFHPALTGFAKMQQEGNLSVVQNVGYPEPNRSHFRSQEIWQTASASSEYINEGWLGRYLDLECKDHQPTAGINIDAIDNLSLIGNEPNSITVKNPEYFKIKRSGEENVRLSENPQLDFARKVASGILEGSADIQTALKKSTDEISYPKSSLGRNLSWIGRLIKGNLNTKVYYTSLGGFDTHDSQLNKHAQQLGELNDAVTSFYDDLKQAGLLSEVTVVIFSEFGRRAADNGKGTDHGKAAPMFVIGGATTGKIIGKNPDLANLDAGDVKYDIDFRSVYASLLTNKLAFDPKKIGIKTSALSGLF